PLLGFEGCAAVWAGEMAEPVLHRGPEGVAALLEGRLHRGEALGVAERGALPVAAQLGDLLLEGQRGQERLDALIGAAAPVVPQGKGHDAPSRGSRGRRPAGRRRRRSRPLRHTPRRRFQYGFSNLFGCFRWRERTTARNTGQQAMSATLG